MPKTDRKQSLHARLTILAMMVACLVVAEPAQGFFSRGVIDGDLGYASLEIYKDQEDYWGGTGVYPAPRSHRRGRINRGWGGFYSQDEYYLTGSLENLSNRTRRNLRVVFNASDCVRDRTHWIVSVVIDQIDPHESVPFRKFISYSQPKFPCRFRFHVTETPAPSPVPPETHISPPTTSQVAESPPEPPPVPPPPDNAPVYKWIDENGVPHYTNRPIAPEDTNWRPAWGEKRW